MTSAITSQTLQGAILSITSNVIAQAIASYQADVRIVSVITVVEDMGVTDAGRARMHIADSSGQTPFTLDVLLSIKFAGFSIVSNPPNIIWQVFLEGLFPTSVPTALHPKRDDGKAKPRPEIKLSKTNVAIKFILDQTFGAVLNTLMFVVYMGYVNAPAASSLGSAWDNVLQETQENFWPMIVDGYKFWPAVSLASFLWIPVEKRVVFGCSAGVIWGTYLSLIMGS